MNGASLLSIATAVPEGSISQEDAAEIACAKCGRNGRTRAIRGLYRRSGVRRRGSVLSDADGSINFYTGEAPPATSERMALYAEHAGPLAARAARDALDRAEVAPGSITHIVTASCTGFGAPGVDLELIRTLGLSSGTRRTHVGFMGCHAAINALAAADAFARVGGCVLVCCAELCSLHFAYDERTERQVANALFADGAAAAVVARRESPGVHRFGGFGSVVIPQTQGLMTWGIGNTGFEMHLSPRVPEVLAERVPGWVRPWLADLGLTPEQVGSWAIHPGGPRVLSAVSGCLGLAEGADKVSREILTTHGNMSSPTVLFIMDRLLRGGGALPLVALAFGPGLAGEALLLRSV